MSAAPSPRRRQPHPGTPERLARSDASRARMVLMPGFEWPTCLTRTMTAREATDPGQA